MANFKEQEYWQKVFADPSPEATLEEQANELLRHIKPIRKMPDYKPLYHRSKLACKFVDGNFSNRPSWDYYPRLDLRPSTGELRILDEGKSIRQLIELATKWHNAGRLKIATLFISLSEDTYTRHEVYNFALGQWGNECRHFLGEYKLLQSGRDFHKKIVRDPVHARVEAILDLDFLSDFPNKIADR